MKAKPERVGLIILAILLILAVGYIVGIKWKEREQAIYMKGAQYGYAQSILTIMDKAGACEAVPVYADGGNTTLHLVATECLQGQGKVPSSNTSK